MRQLPVEVYVAANALEAQLLVEQLKARGVAAQLHREQAAFTGLWFDSPRVLVPLEHEEFSRVVVAKFERELKHHPPTVEVEASVDDWPTCPRCQTRRLTACPLCDTAGNRFELGFSPGDESLRMCPGCEEPFVPEFYRRCHHCGHEFESGREPPQERRVEVENTARGWLAFVGLIVAVAALLSYFIRLFV